MTDDFDGTRECAERLDRDDPLRDFATRFELPEDASYLCGNCLGLPPRSVRRALEEVVTGWAEKGFRAHFTAPERWVSYPEDHLIGPMAAIVGALPSETALMNSLSMNLHAMLVSFFRPTGARRKVLMEEGAFPSDQLVVDSQLRAHGLSADDCVVLVRRREDDGRLDPGALLDAIDRHGDELALVLLGDTCFRTGQALDLAPIAAAAKRKGCVVGFDLAHAVGNVALSLHDWGVDFAVWCTYKYLNGGPGGVGGCFVHERHFAGGQPLPRLEGWWGNEPAARFARDGRARFVPAPGAQGWQASSPPIVSMAALRESLAMFGDAGMDRLVAKSRRLGAYLQHLLDVKVPDACRSLTPRAPDERGCQFTLRFGRDARELQAWLLARGVVCDAQGSDMIRVAPVPLYNRFADVHRFVEALEAFFATHAVRAP
jgi:kynureninase